MEQLKEERKNKAGRELTPGEMKYLFASFLHECTPCFKNSSSVHLFILLIIIHFYFYGMENDIKKMY
ncbi:MAG: hypothetical protein ACI4UV_19550, partial [Victivallales bacterium]